MNHRAYGFIKDGAVSFYNPKWWEDILKSLGDCDVDVSIGKHKRTRSSNQNSFYWGVVLPTFAKELGYTTEELHDALKIKFLSAHQDSDLPTVRSTTKLTTIEFKEYIDKIQRLAAEHGVNIPNPTEAEPDR